MSKVLYEQKIGVALLKHKMTLRHLFGIFQKGEIVIDFPFSKIKLFDDKLLLEINGPINKASHELHYTEVNFFKLKPLYMAIIIDHHSNKLPKYIFLRYGGRLRKIYKEIKQVAKNNSLPIEFEN